jgi:Fur family transcriptional regulator, ferric uptake regulator
MNLTKRKIISLLRERGYKLTPQRKIVLEAMAITHERFTSDDIFASIHIEHPEIGLVTIYRTLNILAEAGLICEVHTGKRRSYIMRRPTEHHHHLVCSQCGQVVDFAGCDLRTLEEQLSRETGFKIEGHLLEFSGCCRDCSNAKDKSN